MLRVVALVADAARLVILGTLHACLLGGTHMAVGTGARFEAFATGLTMLQLAGFVVAQRAVLHAVGDALLLVDVAALISGSAAETKAA